MDADRSLMAWPGLSRHQPNPLGGLPGPSPLCRMEAGTNGGGEGPPAPTTGTSIIAQQGTPPSSVSIVHCFSLCGFVILIIFISPSILSPWTR